MNNLDLELQELDEKRQMRNLTNAVKFADSFSLLFVRCNQRSRQKEIIEELKAQLAGYNIKVILFENQIENLLDELEKELGDEKPDAIFVYGLESSFPKADEAAESKFVVTLNHSRNSFKRTLHCPLVLFLPEYALSAVYHGATDFYSIRSGVYLFSAKAEETEQLISEQSSQGYTELSGLLFEERQNRIKTIKEWLTEYQSLPDLQRNLEKENNLKIKLAELYYISGEYEIASNILQGIIEYARSSEDLVLVADSLNSLAEVYKEQGKYNEAIKAHKESIKIAKDTIGTKHSSYATRLNNLALVYYVQEKYEEAIKLYEEAIEIAKETIGIMHPAYATRLNNLALAYQAQGKYNKAIELYEESLNVIKETLGTKHLNYSFSLYNLAWIFEEQKKYQKALQLLEEAYSICIKILGRNHNRTKDIKKGIEMCQEKIKEQASLIVPYKK